MRTFVPTANGASSSRLTLVMDGVHSNQWSVSLMTCHTRSGGAAISIEVVNSVITFEVLNQSRTAWSTNKSRDTVKRSKRERRSNHRQTNAPANERAHERRPGARLDPHAKARTP